MLIDPNGYSPWSWIKERWNDFVDWLNDTPDKTAGNDSSSGGWKYIFSLVAAWGLGGTEWRIGAEAMKYPWKWHNYGNLLRDVKGGLGIVAVTLTVFTTAYDVANTWDANNDNTNGQRLIKNLIQIGGTSINYIVASECIAAIGTALITTGTFFSAPVLVPCAILVGTTVAIYYGSEYLYKQMNIE